ncbi:MAG: RHS repeat-associated core domain-containing protein, partial [Steroidobacteraceae bacterium]
DSVNLVHMNGRVYDPYLGRVLSADSVIQSLGASESINPYAYAWNDPLRYTDPSGHDIFDAIFGLAVGAIAFFALQPELAGLGSFWGSVAAGGIAGFVGGFTGAIVATGSLSAALTAGLISGVAAAAFAGIGSYTQTMNPGSEWTKAFSVVAHAAVGCGSAAASGGNCGRGALAAALSEVAVQGNLIKPDAIGTWGSVKGVAEAGLIGGVAARITGGKFDDGFTVSAAGYLFNSAAHSSFVKARIAEIVELGYDTNAGFEASFIPTKSFSINVVDGTATITQSDLQWEVDASGMKSGGGAWEFLGDHLVGLNVSAVAQADGSLLISGSFSVRYGILGFEFGETRTMSVADVLMSSSGLVGIAARTLGNRGAQIDQQVNCMSGGSCPQ